MRWPFLQHREVQTSHSLACFLQPCPYRLPDQEDGDKQGPGGHSARSRALSSEGPLREVWQPSGSRVYQ